jgi:hypothetical protein
VAGHTRANSLSAASGISVGAIFTNSDSLYASFIDGICIYGNGFFLFKKNASFFDAVLVTTLLFLNPFCRDLVSIPQSEPLAISILILSYVSSSRGAGFLLPVMFMTRPPLVALFLNQCLSQRIKPLAYAMGLLTLATGIVLFGSLFIPGTFRSFGFHVSQIVASFYSFQRDLALQILDHLISYDDIVARLGAIAPFLWSSVLIFTFLFLFWKTKKHYAVWAGSFIYLIAVSMAGPAGVRYVFPLILFWLLEFGFRLNKFVKILLIVICCHHIVRQVDEIRMFRKDRFPETHSKALIEAKEWLAAQHFDHDGLMSYRYRFCANFFQTRCFGPPPSSQNLIQYIKNRSAHFIIFMNRDWQTEDNENQKMIRSYFEKHPELSVSWHDFHGVTLLDVSQL